ncbi:hypothetical protein, partial [Klebsiella pneumoniae]|uniref:hypothetical protein n=1 Tax=Klebsiella pneumoniae TaxID=573 RepID=UPI0019547EDF
SLARQKRRQICVSVNARFDGRTQQIAGYRRSGELFFDSEFKNSKLLTKESKTLQPQGGAQAFRRRAFGLEH